MIYGSDAFYALVIIDEVSEDLEPEEFFY